MKSSIEMLLAGLPQFGLCSILVLPQFLGPLQGITKGLGFPCKDRPFLVKTQHLFAGWSIKTLPPWKATSPHILAHQTLPLGGKEPIFFSGVTGLHPEDEVIQGQVWPI